MEEILELKDRFRKFLDYYSLSPDSLSKKIGGSRGTYFSIQSGKSKPDFATSENILKSFPEISAEWWFRGSGPMLKDDIMSKEEADLLRAENKAVKAMYRAELMGKSKGVSTSPDVRNSELRKKQFQSMKKSLKGKRSVSKPASVHVQGANIPSLADLFSNG